MKKEKEMIIIIRINGTVNRALAFVVNNRRVYVGIIREAKSFS